ncbi:hypothetical protein [Tenacibaculum caenipelagi]|nr:hypothetical protein [Tenacibaculum caenipelagi]
MKKQILSLGKNLSKLEQKQIRGGGLGSTCDLIEGQCKGCCEIGSDGGCYAVIDKRCDPGPADF